MASATFLTPFVQIGRELRFELAALIGAGPLERFQHRGQDGPALLPEQRPDDRVAIEQRKADALLQSVRHGAVRR